MSSACEARSRCERWRDLLWARVMFVYLPLRRWPGERIDVGP